MEVIMTWFMSFIGLDWSCFMKTCGIVPWVFCLFLRGDFFGCSGCFGWGPDGCA